MAVDKVIKVKYDIDLKMAGDEAKAELASISKSLERIADDMNQMVKSQNTILKNQLSKIAKIGEQSKKNTEYTKKQTTYAKELSDIVSERAKLEEQLSGKKIRSTKALQGLITKYENQLRKSDEARAVSANKRSEADKKALMDKKKFAETEVKLLNAKIELQNNERVSLSKTKEEAYKLYEQEKLRLEVEGKRKALLAKPPTTASTQREELRTLLRLKKLEEETHGKSLEYYRLEKKAIEKARDLKKSLAMDEKQTTYNRIKQEEARAKATAQLEVLENHSTKEILKQSDVLRGDLAVMQARLKVLKNEANVEHTITEQARLQEQIAKKKITLQKTILSEKKAEKDNSLLGTLKHASQVAPVYMLVAQAAMLAQQAIGEVITATLEFDNTMRVLSAVTGENISKTRDLTAGIMALGEAYGGSLADYAETAKSLSRAGIDTSELVKATEVTAQLGLITGDTIDSASNAIISYSQVYQKAGNQIVYTTGEIGDKLAYMANASRLSTEDIGTLSNYALASSKSVGMTIDVVNSLAVAFSNAGNNASTIGTQIRRFTSTLTSSSIAVKEFYAATGTNRRDFTHDLLASKSGKREDIQKSNQAFEDFVHNVQSLSENEYRDAIQGMNILDNQFFNQLRNNGDEIVMHLKKSFSGLDGELEKTAVIADGMARRWEAMGNRIITSNEGWVGSLGGIATDLAEYFLFGKTMKDFETSKFAEMNQLLSTTRGIEEKRIHLLERINELKSNDKEISTGMIVDIRKLNIKTEEYHNLINKTKNLDLSKEDDLKKFNELQAEATINIKERVEYVKQLGKSIQENNSRLEIQNEIKKKTSAISIVNELDKKKELTHEEEVQLELNRNIVEQTSEKIRLAAKLANFSKDEINHLTKNEEIRKSITSEVYLSRKLQKEEVQSLETLARALGQTTDQRQLAVGIQAVQAGIDRNKLASATKMASLIEAENRLREIGSSLDLEKNSLGATHLQQLMDENNWLESTATVQIASAEAEKRQADITKEKLQLESALQDSTNGTLNLSKAAKETIKDRLKVLKDEYSELSQITNSLELVGGILSTNLKLTNALGSANSQISTVIQNQLAPMREVTAELQKQYRLKSASMGMTSKDLIGKSRTEALSTLGTSVDKLYANAKTPAEFSELNKELRKEVLKINKFYDNEELKASRELTSRKKKLEKDLSSDLLAVGKNTSQTKKARLEKEYNDRVSQIKTLYTKETGLDKYLAEAKSIMLDKIHKSEAKYQAKSTAIISKKQSAQQRAHNKLVKAQLKEIALKNKEQRLADEYAKKSIKYQSLEFQVNNGYEDKLKVLQQELSYLHERDNLERGTRDAVDHVISIKNKELEILKEQVAYKEKLKSFDQSVSNATSPYISYDTQINRKTEDTVYSLNKQAKELGKDPLSKEQIAKIKENIKKDIDPTFSESIADAFGINTNKTLKDNLKDLKPIFANIVKGAFDSISADYAQTGDIQGAIQNFTDSNALRDGLKNSGNPYAMAAGYASEIISGALTGQQNAFQAQEVNIGGDSTGIADSLKLLTDDVMFPQLEHTKSMRQHLENMDKNFNSIAIGLASSGKYDYSGSSLDVKDSLSSLSKVGLKLGGLFGNNFLGDTIGGLLTGLFGSSHSEVTRAGLEFGNQTVDAFIKGVNARSYTDIKTTSSSFFGLIKSTSYSTQFGGVDNGLKEKLAESLKYGVESIVEAGVALGLDRLDLEKLASSQTISLGKFNFKGMSQEAISKTLSGVFGTQLGKIAEGVVPIVKDFKHLDEDYLKALTRTASGYESATEALRRMNVEVVAISDIGNKRGDVTLEAIRSSLLQNVDGISTGIADMVDSFTGTASALVDTYKGLDNFQYQLRLINNPLAEVTQTMIYGAKSFDNLARGQNSFIKNFFTDAEQSDIAMSSLNRQFEALNLTMPKSKDAFRQLVESVDITTESGQTLYGQLMNISSGFSDVFSTLDKGLKTFTDAWLGNLSYLTQREKQRYAQGLVNLSKTATSIDTLGALKDLAKASKETTASKYDYAPFFNNYAEQLKIQSIDASRTDLLNELKKLREEVQLLREDTNNNVRYA